MQRRRRLAIAALAVVGLAAPTAAAPPQEGADGAVPVTAEGAPAETLGAAARLTSIDERLRQIDAKRGELRAALESREGDRVDEGRRARRLAREILLSELHGHALASTPRELVRNATMRSGLRRVASRTLAAHGERAHAVDEAKGALAAVDLEEAKLRADRVAAEAELRLEQEDARRRREALRQIFEAEPGEVRMGGGHARVRVAEAGDDDEGGSSEESFKARKGKLPLPVQRKCRIKSRRSEEFGGAYLAITSSKASNVRAVSSGTVAFADELPPYGKLVVVDHGDGYFTVYGGLSRIGTGTGAALREGTVVGALDADASLVFQLRSGTRTLAPSSWFRQRKRETAAEGAAP
jgi:murein DD-endopeptidase MepM/ murein hydrolase activator NlpD